jgi:glycosyl transferase, family 25
MSRAKRPSAGLIDATFPHSLCINLDRRPERWQSMQRKFDQHGIHSVRRLSAVDGNKIKLPENWAHSPGAFGCLLSHLQVVREARRFGVPSVLIFEDDVVFDEQLEKKFGVYVDQLPPDWDMLFFGALHRDEPVTVTENIARITQAYSTYAYVLRDTTFADFIELNRNSELELDNNSLILQRRFNCYCFTPNLAWVETDYSDAQQRLVDHWYLRESLVLFGPQIDRLLSETTIVFAHGDHDGVGRATENLIYLTHYYHRHFSPHLAMIIVEQGAQPTVAPATLPANCKYVFLRDTNSFDKERCFVTGISHSDPNRKRVILSDSDIYLDTLHIRANLRMCERYDHITGFSKIIDLTREDSQRLRNTKTAQGIDIMKNHSRKNGRDGYCLFLNREAIQMAGRHKQGSEQIRSLLSLQAPRQYRVFQSPNHALRLT